MSPLFAAGFSIVAMQVLGVLLEAPLLALGDKWPRRRMISLALAVNAGCCVLAALAPGYWTLLAALLLYGPSSGIALSLGQACLVDAYPDARERVLARWALCGEIGDLLTPGLLALLSGSYRLAFGVCGALVLADAVAVWRGPELRNGPLLDDDDDAPRGPPATLWSALRNKRLLMWTAAGLFCAFIDEILVAFGALDLDQRLGLGPDARALVFTAWVLGAIAGATVTDRLLARWPVRRILIFSCVGCCLALGVWLWAPSFVLCSIALATVGFFAAPMYPIAKAQAYAALPHGSGTVAALGAILQAFELGFPLAMGLLANRFGVTVALAALFLQPLALLVCVPWLKAPRL